MDPFIVSLFAIVNLKINLSDIMLWISCNFKKCKQYVL